MSSKEPSGKETIPGTDTIDGNNRILTKKRLVVIYVVIIIILTVLIIDVLNNEYEVDIQRSTDTAEEKEALQVVEGLDLEEYINDPRYTGWGSRDYEEPPDDIRAYVYANFLDKETLDYYQWKIDALRNNWADVRAKLQYKAECTVVNNTQVTVYCNVAGNNVFFTLASDDATFYLSGRAGYIENITHDASEHQHNFTPSYIVVQNFYYSEGYNPEAAFMVNIDQITLLDEDMNLLAVVIDSGHGIS